MQHPLFRYGVNNHRGYYKEIDIWGRESEKEVMPRRVILRVVLLGMAYSCHDEKEEGLEVWRRIKDKMVRR